eukprot:50195-Pelagomonas_calceolata.AAC.2
MAYLLAVLVFFMVEHDLQLIARTKPPNAEDKHLLVLKEMTYSSCLKVYLQVLKLLVRLPHFLSWQRMHRD